MRRLATQVELPDWLQLRLRWATAPSWLVSAAFHIGLWGALLTLSQMPGCQPDLAGDGGDSFRPVGLVARPSPAPPGPIIEDDAQSPAESAAAVQAATTDSLPATAAPAAVPDQPPVPLQLPGLPAAPVIGASGPPRTGHGVAQLLDPARTGSRARQNSGGDGGGGETSFFGISDAAKRFVYIIDSSSSMQDYGALRIAKTELLASLERLEETQQFQVLFCNSGLVTRLKPGRFDMFYGTDAQRLEVRLQIAGIAPDHGTDHFQAIMQGLALNPEVIFYLSDGGEPPLLPRELEEIRNRNRGGARIHCIEFGISRLKHGADGRPIPNFLTKLSAQNQGQYIYRDVTQLSNR